MKTRKLLRLKRWRESFGINPAHKSYKVANFIVSQGMVAKWLGRSRQTISELENGRRTPSPDSMAKIIKLIQCKTVREARLTKF